MTNFGHPPHGGRRALPKRLDIRAKQEIRRLAREGLTDSAIARRIGCSRQSVARIRGAEALGARPSKDRILQVRLSAGEAEAFEGLVAQTGMTTSELLRHMIRCSAGAVDLRKDEMAELRQSSNQLNALARNLVQMLQLARAGRLRWNARDGALVARLAARTEEVAIALQRLRMASARGMFAAVQDGVGAETGSANA